MLHNASALSHSCSDTGIGYRSSLRANYATPKALDERKCFVLSRNEWSKLSSKFTVFSLPHLFLAQFPHAQKTFDDLMPSNAPSGFFASTASERVRFNRRRGAR